MAEPKWLTVARGELNTREIEGPKSNSRIVEYSKVSVGTAAADSEAWCAKFVGWCFAKDGLDETDGTRRANARSYLDWGKELKDPALGCVVVFWRVSPKSWQGHVAFFIKENATHVWCLGGNQGNKVSIAKYPKSQVLGYRWPKKADAPTPKPEADPALKRVQARLKELGYHEVGNPDGLWGTKTRAAVRAFYDDWNERNPDDALKQPAGTDQADLITDAFLVALAKASPRTVSVERETAEDEKIGDYAAVKESKKTSRVGLAAAAAGAIGAANESGVLEKAEEVAEAATRVQGIGETVAGVWAFVEPLWPFALIAVGIAVFLWVRKIRKEEIESYRMGETP